MSYRRLYNTPIQPQCYLRSNVVKSSSSLPVQIPLDPVWTVPATKNLHLFHGAHYVNANNGTFNQVGGNQYNIRNDATSLVMEENAYIDKLPRAKSAGHRSGSHKVCLEGTRTAILQDIEGWEADDKTHPVYWLKGVGGCGKSTIAQTFAVRSAERGRLLSSFFCSRDFPDRSDLRLILPTLAHDLAHQDPTFKRALVETLEASPDLEHDSLEVQMDKFIVWPLKSTGLSITIVIDALDECKDYEPVSHVLYVLAKFMEDIPNMKIFITGRPEDHLRSGFTIPSLRTKEMPLHDAESVTADIRLYVKTLLEEIAIRKRQWLHGPWPSDSDIDAITKRAAGLFVVASVILAFVDHPYAMPQDCLNKILSITDSAVYARNSVVYDTYRQVLLASFRDVDPDDLETLHQFRLVVGSIVLSFRPLSRASLAKILDIPSERISMILSRLHSVLVVPDSDTQAIRLCHKSFADFVTDAQYCTDKRFYIDAHSYHLEFGALCLQLMKGTLTTNICRLPRYVMNRDIEDLDTRREKYIGEALVYSCDSWTKHLRSSIGTSNDPNMVIPLIHYCFNACFLSWLEVLSLEDNLCAAVYSLRDVQHWLTDIGSTTTWSSSNLIEDCERFVLRFFDLMKESATHIYHSALPWSPASSLTRAVYQSQLKSEANIVTAADHDWDSCIRTIHVDDDMMVLDLVFSPKGGLIAAIGDKFIKVFETATGACLSSLDSTGRSRYCVAFSQDEKFVVSTSE